MAGRSSVGRKKADLALVSGPSGDGVVTCAGNSKATLGLLVLRLRKCTLALPGRCAGEGATGGAEQPEGLSGADALRKALFHPGPCGMCCPLGLALAGVDPNCWMCAVVTGIAPGRHASERDQACSPALP